MRLRLAIQIIAFCALNAPQAARAQDSCMVLFRSINQTISAGYVKDETHTKVARIFETPEMTGAQKARQAFDLIARDRLALLDPPVADRIRTLLKDRVERAYYSEGQGFRGSFYTKKTGDHTIKTMLPESLRDTVLEYAILVHEMEHAIQWEITAGRIRPGPKLTEYFKGLLNFANRRFEIEMGAMLSEYEFLRTIPEPARLSLLEELRTTPRLEEDSRKMLIRFVELKAKAPSLHVASEHAAGRYDIESLRGIQKFGVVRAVALPVLPALPFVLAGGWTTLLCQEKARRIKFEHDPVTPFYSAVCRRLKLVKEIEGTPQPSLETRNQSIPTQ